LSHLEKVTGEAAEAVTESSSDAIRLRRALDTLPQGVIVCDENGEVAFRNARAVALMNNRHGDALAAQAVTELLENAWQDGSAERTLDLYGPPRQTLTVRTRLVDDGRRPLGVIAIIEDVSERRRLEEIRRDFVANVSHELKTPIGALGLLAETLTVEPDSIVAQRLASRINTEAFRVSRIIDDLLDLSRIESEEAPPREPIYVSLVMAEAVERVKSAADQRRITIELDEPNPPVHVLGDRRQLVSAMHSLLENAVTFSYEDSIVRVSGSHSDGEVHLAVTDVGVGIPTRDLERIFERFYRVDHGRSRASGGTGLGLSIVRHVASNHQGHVEVDSREGEGSTFTLVLPCPPEYSA
jgi:two-component system sensor histidine kinase SenX3